MQISWFEYFQIMSLFIAVLCWRGLKACSLLAFIPLLIIANAAEISGGNYRSFGLSSNYFIYNLYLLFSTPFFFFLAGKMLFLTRKEQVVFNLVCTLALLLIFVNFCCIQGQIKFNTFSLVLVEILNIVFAGLCLVRLTVFDQKELNFMREPYFWINALNLLFALITLVLLGLQDYILINHIQIAHKSLYYAILPAVNAVVYAGYSYAFILCRIRRTR